jgi:hypothetical protein
VRDGTAYTAPELEAQLRQLSCLAGAGLAGHDDDLVITDRSEQVVVTRGNGQLRRVRDLGDGRAPSLRPSLRLGELLLETRPALLIVPTEPTSLPAKALFVTQRQLTKRRLIDEWHLRRAGLCDEPGGGERVADGGHAHRE